MIVAGLVSGLLCVGVVMLFNGDTKMILALKVLAVSVVCLVSYIGMNLILKMEYCEILFDRLKGKVLGSVKK